MNDGIKCTMKKGFAANQVPVAGRMWGRALLLVLLTALSADGEDAQEESQLQVGRSVDIFTRYGYLSLSMKVVPVNLSDFTTIFREPSVDVFTGLDPYIVHPPRERKSIFDGDFHMEFCDNKRQLLQAYFRDFNFEKLGQPWRTFTASWSTETIAKHMGINGSFVQREFSYILVRLSRFRETVKLSRLPQSVNLTDLVAKEIDSVKIGDFSSVMTFIRKFGSHYINSYVTGNSLYQVFVYKKNTYNKIKYRLKKEGVSRLTSNELTSYFSPWHAQHIGKIKVASGNKTVESWVSKHFHITYYIFTYPSLLKIHGNNTLLAVLNRILENEALLEIDFKALSVAFKNPAKQLWFEEVLSNLIHLWESNF